MLNTLKHRVARFVYPTGSVRTIRRGPLKGQRFIVGPGIGVSYAWGIETMNWDWFGKHVQRGMSVYDVGANRGQMALMLAQLVSPSGRVVSFEPVLEVYADLVRNVDLNQHTQVRTVNAAVAEFDGELSFTFDPTIPTQGQITGCEPDYHIVAAPTTVKAVKLDSFVINELPPALIKIDVEGGGARVLAGATELIREHRPIVYVELHGPSERAAVRDSLQACGYTIRTTDGDVVYDVTTSPYGVLCCFPNL